MSESVHPTAVIHSATRIPPDVTVGPYAVIEDGVELGLGTLVGAHAIIRTGTVTGARCVIDAHAVLGGLPQDLRFEPRTPSGVRLGDDVTVREGVTIHRATREGQMTEIGSGAFLMSYVHVGHDSVVGAQAILANNVMLAGCVTVGPHAFLGGGAAVHQHVRIGESVMVSGLSRVSRDVGPFLMIAERDEIIGLNLVGLKRRGFERAAIRAIKQAYRELFREPGNLRTRAETLLAEPWSAALAASVFLKFFLGGKRGFARPVARRRTPGASELPNGEAGE